MMFPVGQLWGDEIYSAPLPGSGFDLYRVIANQDATNISVDLGNRDVRTLAFGIKENSASCGLSLEPTLLAINQSS